MAGLIGNYIGASLGKGISDIGGMMFKAADQRMAREDRAAEKADERAYRMERDALERDKDMKIALMNDETRRMMRSGGGEGGSGGITEIPEGSLVEETIAGSQGMSVPEYRAWRKAQQTGDYSDLGRAYGGTVKSTEVDEDSEGYLSVRKTVEYPPGFDDVKADRVKRLAEIQREFIHGKNYKEITEADRIRQGMALTDDAVKNPGNAGKNAQGFAAGEGKPLYGGDSNVTRNNYTGATTTTEVGKATIGEKGANAKRMNERVTSLVDTGDFKAMEAQRKLLTSQLDSLARREQAELKATIGEEDRALVRERYAGLRAPLERDSDELNAALKMWYDKNGTQSGNVPPSAAAPRAPGASGIVSGMLNSPAPSIYPSLEAFSIKRVK